MMNTETSILQGLRAMALTLAKKNFCGEREEDIICKENEKDIQCLHAKYSYIQTRSGDYRNGFRLVSRLGD